jgi:hypothetical protein
MAAPQGEGRGLLTVDSNARRCVIYKSLVISFGMPLLQLMGHLI